MWLHAWLNLKGNGTCPNNGTLYARSPHLKDLSKGSSTSRRRGHVATVGASSVGARVRIRIFTDRCPAHQVARLEACSACPGLRAPRACFSPEPRRAFLRAPARSRLCARCGDLRVSQILARGCAKSACVVSVANLQADGAGQWMPSLARHVRGCDPGACRVASSTGDARDTETETETGTGTGTGVDTGAETDRENVCVCVCVCARARHRGRGPRLRLANIAKTIKFNSINVYQ